MIGSFDSDRIFLHDIRLYILAVVLAIFSWWLVISFEVDPTSLEKKALISERSVDYFSVGYVKKELNKTGQLKTQLEAEKLFHYKEDGITEMIQPKMTLYNKDTPPWIIRAETGILSADGKNLQLNGQVFIDRAASGTTRELKLKTSNLRVKTQENYAEGDDWAELRSGENWIHGEGIQMVFKRPISLKLLAKVKSYYEFD